MLCCCFCYSFVWLIPRSTPSTLKFVARLTKATKQQRSAQCECLLADYTPIIKHYNISATRHAQCLCLHSHTHTHSCTQVHSLMWISSIAVLIFALALCWYLSARKYETRSQTWAYQCNSCVSVYPPCNVNKPCGSSDKQPAMFINKCISSVSVKCIRLT